MALAKTGSRRFGRAPVHRGAGQRSSVRAKNAASSSWADEASIRDGAGASEAEKQAVDRLKQLSVIAAAAVAVAFVSIAFGVWQSASASTAVDAATRNQAAVLVTTREIHAGEVIAEADLSSQLVPQAYRAEGVYLAQSASTAGIVGARVLVDVPAGTQLSSGSIASAGGDGRIAGSLSEGMEAVSISVDDETGVSGQIKPLDHVRIVSVETESGGSAAVVEMCESARVLSTGGDGAGEGVSYAAVTVEVTPDQADEIRAAQSAGRVSLQLIATADASSAEA